MSDAVIIQKPAVGDVFTAVTGELLTIHQVIPERDDFGVYYRMLCNPYGSGLPEYDRWQIVTGLFKQGSRLYAHVS